MTSNQTTSQDELQRLDEFMFSMGFKLYPATSDRAASTRYYRRKVAQFWLEMFNRYYIAKEKVSNTDRNGDKLVGEVLDIIDRDNSRYQVAQGVAASIREGYIAKETYQLDIESVHKMYRREIDHLKAFRGAVVKRDQLKIEPIKLCASCSASLNLDTDRSEKL